MCLPYRTYQVHIHLRNPLTYLTCTYSLNRFYQNKTSQLGTKVAKATGFFLKYSLIHACDRYDRYSKSNHPPMLPASCSGRSFFLSFSPKRHALRSKMPLTCTAEQVSVQCVNLLLLAQKDAKQKTKKQKKKNKKQKKQMHALLMHQNSPPPLRPLIIRR